MTKMEMTQKQAFTLIAEVMGADYPEIEAFCEKKLAQLNRPRKSTGPKAEVLEFRAAVATQLAEMTGCHSAREIADAMGEEVTSAKVASALRSLVADEIVVKTSGSRKKDPALYMMADEVNED